MDGGWIACLSRAPPAWAIAVCAVLGIGASPAAAGSIGARRPAALHAPAKELTAAPVTAASLAATDRQQTGKLPSQLTGRIACSVPTPVRLKCLAEVELSSRTERPVTPLLPRAPVLDQLRTIGLFSSLLPIGPLSPELPLGPLSPSLGLEASPTTEPTAPEPTTAIGRPPPAAGTPAFLQRAYDLTYLSAHRGSRDTIAVVDAYDDRHAASDLAMFRDTFGLPPCTTADGCFREVNQLGHRAPPPRADPTGDWELEESLDLDAVSALCPRCHIVLVQAASASLADIATGVRTAATIEHANQVSLSLGQPATTEAPGQWTYPGASTLAASGDSGYAGANNVNVPAGHPVVSSIGGTELAAARNARGVAESAWSASGSGCAPGIPRPSFQAGLGACTGRSIAGVSAVAWGADLDVYDSSRFDGSAGWFAVGGTSLATPLVAAFQALTGVDSTHNPVWAYRHERFLNDIVSGSNDSTPASGGARCSAVIAYICNAGPGYDGPTGVGSISGDVVPGAPGIGGTFNETQTSTSALIAGGIYPNSERTAYRVQYGRTASYGSETRDFEIGSVASLVTVQIDLRGLRPNAGYHCRLVASNRFGTTYGYDATFTTPAHVRTSTRPRRPEFTAVPTLQGRATVGSVVRLAGGRYRHGSPSEVGFYRCARSCGLLRTASRTPDYRLADLAAGYLVRARVTVSGRGGSASAWTQGFIGPVSSRSAGAVEIQIRRQQQSVVEVRDLDHRRLAQVRTRPGRRGTSLTVEPSARQVRVRVYVLSGAKFAFHGPATGKPLSITVTRGETVDVSAVRPG